MKNWILFDFPATNEPKHKIVKGVDIDMFISPYEIPQAFRCEFDKSRKTLVVQFKYIQDEPTEGIRVDDAGIIKVGKHSNRIFEIQTSATSGAPSGTFVSSRIIPTLVSTIDYLDEKSSTENHQLIKDAITSDKSQILTDIKSTLPAEENLRVF